MIRLILFCGLLAVIAMGLWANIEDSGARQAEAQAQAAPFAMAAKNTETFVNGQVAMRQAEEFGDVATILIFGVVLIVVVFMLMSAGGRRRSPPPPPRVIDAPPSRDAIEKAYQQGLKDGRRARQGLPDRRQGKPLARR